MADAPLLIGLQERPSGPETPPLPGTVALGTYTFVQDGHPLLPALTIVRSEQAVGRSADLPVRGKSGDESAQPHRICAAF